MTRSVPPGKRPRLGVLFLPVWLALLGVAVAVFVLAVGPRVHEQALERARHNLDLLADVRETAIDGWRQDAIADARTVAGFPTTGVLVNPASPDAPDRHFTAILDRFAELHRGSSIVILDRSLRVRAGTTGSAAPTAAVLLLARAAFAAGRDTLEVLAHPAGATQVNVVALTPEHDGCAITEYDPAQWLDVLLDPVPLGLASGEALLVRREPGRVVVLTPGARHRFHVPATLPDVARTSVYADTSRATRGLDDRGRMTIAAQRAIPGQAWALLFKADEADVLAPSNRQLANMALATALLLTALEALAFALVWGQRRANEAELARNRDRLAIQLDLANEAIATLSPTGVILHANRSAEEFFGPPGTLVGRDAFDSFAAPGSQPSRDEIAGWMARDGKARYETEVMNRDGLRVPVEVSLRSVTLEGSTQWVTLMRDLRDRKRTEARIQRLNRLLRASSEVSIAINRATDPKTLLEAACRIVVDTGGFRIANVALRRPDGTLEMGAIACEPPLTPERIPAIARPGTFQSGISALAISTGHAIAVQDPGDPRLGLSARENLVLAGTHSCASSPFRVGERIGGALSLFSVEPDSFDSEAIALLEGIAAELGQALQTFEDRRTHARVEERLGALFAAGPVGFAVAGAGGVVTHANPEYLRMAGRDGADLAAGRLTLAGPGTGADAAAGDAPPPFETELVRPDGSSVPVLVGWMRLHVAEGGSLAVVLDLTRQHETAETLRQTQLQLVQAQKMETIGQLAGGVAHDFNNLLTVIHGYAELLRSGVDGDSEHASRVDQILRAADRASGLTRQLLAFSRRQVLEPRRLDLRVVVQDAATMLRRLLGTGVQLVVEAPETLGPVMADPGQVEQVLLNLVVNARDAMPGGGSIRVGVSDADVDAAWAAAHPPIKPGPYVRIHVSDDGTGIAPEHLAHIFEPFFTTKEVGKGTGLGLATVYGIVKQSGGYVFVDSKPGRGTTFQVLLPRADAATPAAGLSDAPRPERLAPRASTG